MNETLSHFLEKTCDAVMNLRRYERPRPTSNPPRTVAHRGAWNPVVTENTMGAFEAARALGAWAIEFDVHFTKDLEPVVHHDADLSRIFGHSAKISELSWREVKALAPELPNLQEVLSLTGLHFMIELKVAMTPQQQEVLERHLLSLEPIKAYHILTLDPGLVRLGDKLPSRAWMLVGDMNVADLMKRAEEMRLGGVAGHYLFVTDRWIQWLHERGMMAGVGFVPSPNLFNREWRRGVDWVFTNHMKSLASVSK